jgi:hypothetical protein
LQELSVVLQFRSRASDDATEREGTRERTGPVRGACQAVRLAKDVVATNPTRYVKTKPLRAANPARRIELLGRYHHANAPMHTAKVLLATRVVWRRA